METYRWDRLNHLQVGRYAEYLTKMEFALYGCDVYSAEVDDRGVDFVVRKGECTYYDVQVKSSRELTYVFLPKNKFCLRDNLLLALVLLFSGKPAQLHLIPSAAWRQTNSLFCNRNYEGRKSKPEWGLNLSRRNMPLLTEFAFNKQIGLL